MMRALFTAVLLFGAAAFAELPDAGAALDAPVQHEGKVEIVEVRDGVLRDVEGRVEQVVGGAYLPHTALVDVAQRMARLEGENAALRVLIGVTIGLTVLAAGFAAYEWAQGR